MAWCTTAPDAKYLTQVQHSRPIAAVLRISRYDFPRTHHETQFEYHLLLQGGNPTGATGARDGVSSSVKNIQDTVALRALRRCKKLLTESTVFCVVAFLNRCERNAGIGSNELSFISEPREQADICRS